MQCYMSILINPDFIEMGCVLVFDAWTWATIKLSFSLQGCQRVIERTFTKHVQVLFGVRTEWGIGSKTDWEIKSKLVERKRRQRCLLASIRQKRPKRWGKNPPRRQSYKKIQSYEILNCSKSLTAHNFIKRHILVES